MSDSFVQLNTDGTGKKVDTRVESTNSEHRQVFVVGDPTTNAGVAPVDATKGLAVDLSATGANVNKLLVTPDLPSGAATGAKQDTGNASLASIDGKIPASPATSGKQDTGNASLSSIDSKIPVSPATAGNQTTANSSLATVATNTTWKSTDFWPMYNRRDIGGGVPAIDQAGALVTRGAINTDEGTFRTSFTGSSLSSSIGTATFTNGSSTVTGTGFSTYDLHYGDFVKLNADAESAWAQVLFVNSDTSLSLFTAYTGTGGTGASSSSQLAPTSGTGTTISVGSGQLTLALGTNTSASASVVHGASAGPSIYQLSASISQRVANQDIYIGLETAISSPIKQFARFHFTGATNTVVKTETGYNPTTDPSASEQETNTITYASAGTSATAHVYRIEQQADQIIFSIDGVVVATHTLRIPHYINEGNNTVYSTLRGTNSGIVTNTNIVADYMLVRMFDRIDTAVPNLATDTSNNLKITEATKLAGEDITNDILKTEVRGSYTNITTNATTTIKSGSGEIYHITVNNPALITVANLTITVFDNTAASGTKIGTFTVPFGLTTSVPFDIPFNEAFSTGLTIVTAGPTVTGDLTVAYR